MYYYNMKYENNIFTKIINKEIKSNIIYENANAIAIHDIYPKQKIHILIIPKGHYVNYFDFINNAHINEINDFNNIYKQIITQYNLMENHKIIINNGAKSEQEIFHMHMHILSNE